MHRTKIAMIVPFTRDGKVLLQKRTQNAPDFPGLWSFFGGHVEEDETPEKAIIREAAEEIGLHLPDLPLFRKYSSATHDRYTYLYRIDIPEATLRRQQREGDDLGYFSP